MFIRGLAGADRKSRGAGLMRALLACCLAGMAMGLTGEAPWGNAWSDSAGVLATSFAPLSIFYTCSVRDLTYTTLAACNAACEMGRCYMRQEMPTVPSITPPATASGMSVSKMAPGIMIGQRLEMIVQGAAGSNMVNISVMEDPGLPVGMSYEWLNPQGTQLKLVWMPRSTQFGKIHELVVTGKQGGVSAYPWRVQIPVIGPSFEWAKPGEEGETVTAVVGSPTSVELRCNSNYLSEIVVAEGHNLANGMVLAATSPVSRLYVDGQLGDYPVATSNIIYTPPTGSDGTTDTACFDCKVMGESKRRCVTFEVELCKYTVKDGDSLTSISRNLFFQSNWRRLWNVNAHLPADPDATLQGGSVIALGPVYTTKKGDSINSIAGQFHTTAKSLLLLNPTIADDGVVPAGRGLCIPTCTLLPNPSLDYKNAS